MRKACQFQGWWEEHGRASFPGITTAEACAIYIAGFGRGANEAARLINDTEELMRIMEPKICENGFLHRKDSGGLLEVSQCQACGHKMIIFEDEDHTDLETDHRKRCKVRNREDSRTYG